jgi:hypothetical protein
MFTEFWCVSLKEREALDICGTSGGLFVNSAIELRFHELTD